MACKYSVQLGGVGLIFILECLSSAGELVDLTDATSVEMIFRPPAGNHFTRTAQISTPGTLGQIKYITEVGDLTQKGRWEYQGHVVWPGKDLKTSVATFEVLGNI